MPHYKLSGASILLLIRDGIANDWKSLCEACNLNPDHSRTYHHELFHTLIDLNEVGLLNFTQPVDYMKGTIQGPITIGEDWIRFQNALNISLATIANLSPIGKMLINPFFGAPKPIKNDLDVFVAMPFASELKPVYEDHIKPCCERLGLSVARADDFFTDRSIVEEIWNAINSAKAVIADCTNKNPNVFYEIGIAHTIGKPVIFITQNRDDAPFDIRYIYNIEYTFTPRGMKAFEERLSEALPYATNK